MSRYTSMDNVKVGDRVIIDNSLGIVQKVEKVKLLATVVEKIDNEDVKVEIESSLFKKPVEAVFKYYLFQ